MSNSDKRVFLTGAGGFVATHILTNLVELGYQTVASVRSQPKAQKILDLHPAWKAKVSFAIVPDIARSGAFDHVFKEETTGFDYIIHTASPVNFSVTDFQRDLIDPAVQGQLMKAAYALGGPTIKRLVLLGSSVAIQNSFEDPSTPGPTYSEKDWNPITASQAIASQNPVLGYNASKTLAEHAAWSFMSSARPSPSFDLTVINPDIIIGPILHPCPSAASVNETNAFAVYNFLNGTYTQIDGLKFPFYHFVDVRDVAEGIVRALTSERAGGARIILVGGMITPQLVIDTIRKNFPELRSRVMEGRPGQVLPEGVEVCGWDTGKSFEVFGEGWGYRDLETSVVDTVENLLSLEKSWGQ